MRSPLSPSLAAALSAAVLFVGSCGHGAGAGAAGTAAHGPTGGPAAPGEATAADASGAGGTGGAGAATGAGGSSAASPSPLAAQAVAGVTDPGLRDLLADHWRWTMARAPVWATSLGDHRFDDRIADTSAKGVADDRVVTGQYLDRARKLDRSAMSRADQITLDLLIGQLEAAVATEVCDDYVWSVSAQDNPVSDVNSLPEFHKVVTQADGDHYLSRIGKIPGSVDDVIANLRTGLTRHLSAGAESVRRTIALVDGQLAMPIDKWALMKPAGEPHPGWTAAQRTRFHDQLHAALDGPVRAAFTRYRKLLSDEVLPHARGPKHIGLVALPQGQACYRARILEYTGLPLEPAALHALGLAQLKTINRDMAALGKKLFGARRGGSLRATLHTLRTDRSLYFESGDQIMAAARTALAAAKARIPEYFHLLPKTDCVVSEVPAYEAPYTTIAYYREPHADGSQPGQYFVNTYKPELRPRFELEVLTFHESIPGHHLQIALAQEQDELPAFRRYLGSTAFVEGWALYTERLADQMGLYSGALDRMGMLSFDAWRASRLVVDTGIHAMGWTRAQAEEFMRTHTALTEENIKNEVDRYIGWPGQAVAYKVGQQEILKLRAQAEKALGPAFDIKRFHDVVLGSGAVTLPVLRDNVARWIASQQHNQKGGTP